MKIGVFDSGVGGKLIADRIDRELPRTNVLFIADKDYFPYGNKSQDFIYRRAVVLTKKLAKRGCRLIVAACNSATTNTITKLRDRFPSLVFVGVEPPIKPVVGLSRNGKVAIMGTKATVNSVRFNELKRRFARQTNVFAIACTGLAEAIEHTVASRRPANYRHISFKEKDMTKDIKRWLDRPVAQGVDVIGIGCTHYPYLLSQMKKLYPQVTFYDPASAVVRQVKRILKAI